ncbi:MAG: MATE family efflux transporter [Oscillospiraceae bacterium]|nr:MATE family efflux transporter [Oscillospiraceae bacterium]
MIKQFIGTKDFYKRIIALTLPIMIQNLITNFVNMLDNVMIGKVGTVEMVGVAISNQLIFVFNLCLFGAISGAGIFGAQFYGNRDHKGVRHTFRFKLMICTVLTVIGIAIFFFGGKMLISTYLRGEGDVSDATASLGFGYNYLLIMMIGFLPYAVTQCFSSTLREIEKPMLPMVAGVIAVAINLILNYVLIFGHFGAPKLGVNGAAIATVISRFAELLMVSAWTVAHRKNMPFIIGAFKSLYVPKALVKQIILKGMPLMLNETMWSAGMAMLNQRYSVRGLDVVAANNITGTFWNVFAVGFMSLGVAIGIILGQMLGAGESERAKDSSKKLIAFSVAVSVFIAFAFSACAKFIPMIYNTTPSVRSLATKLMLITAVAMPLDAFANASYFTIRSGGKVMVTFLFDSVFVWAVSVPAAFILSKYTSMNILVLYAIVQGLNAIKCIIGFILVKRGTWIKNLISEQ